MKDPDFEPTPEPKKGFPVGKACLGCSLVLVLGVVLLCGTGGYFVHWAFQKMDEFAAKYEEKGYERFNGQSIVIREPVDSPRVYTGQIVSVQADINADVAVFAQVLEINSTIHGDIDFFGQVIVVKPGGVVDGDIRAELAQVITIEGKVTGEITGNYQVVNGNTGGDIIDADPSTEGPGAVAADGVAADGVAADGVAADGVAAEVEEIPDELNPAPQNQSGTGTETTGTETTGTETTGTENTAEEKTDE